MNMNPMELTDRRIIITGASSGIGRACAVLASQLGASCVLVARSEEKLRETLGCLAPGDHDVISCDLSRLEAVAPLFDQIGRKGKVSGLVHSAGVRSAAPIAYQSIEDMQTAMTVNYFSFLELMKFLSKKRYCEGGSVVAVSSVAAAAGWRGVSLYSGTKGALSASVRALAMELVSKGIRVNAVQPGSIKTPLFDTVEGELSADYQQLELMKMQPLGLGDPMDVAHAVCFLLSNAARFITGTNLVVDGGYLAQ